MLAAQGHQVGQSHGFGEARDPVVAGMNLHQRPGGRADGPLCLRL